MAVIIGQFSSKNCEFDLVGYNKLKSIVDWPNSICKEIRYGNFICNLFFDSSYPYKHHDFHFIDEVSQILIIVSGYVYNVNELKNKYYSRNEALSLPKLILRLFEIYGINFIDKLNGDFSIVIYQKNIQKLYLIRDHLGIHPLAYTQKETNLYFSSDSIGLCRALYSDEPINPEFLKQFLKSVDYQKYELLPNSKVFKVLPAHYCIISGSKIRSIKYWTPEKIRYDRSISYDTVKEDLDILVKDSVKIRCDKKFVAAAHVSGGLDSGIVASLARKNYADQDIFFGLSWSPDFNNIKPLDFDERDLFIKTCNFINATPVFSTPSLNDYMEDLAIWSNNYDFIHEKKLIEFSRKEGIQLIFSGWGGDEFISINDRGMDLDLILGFHWKIFMKVNSILEFKKFTRTLFFYVITPLLGIENLFWYQSNFDTSKYIKNSSFLGHPRLKKTPYSWKSRREVHLKLLYKYTRPSRTDFWNIIGNRAGIEYRYPLLDKRIVEFMLKIPSKILIRKGIERIILRDLGDSHLPEEVRWAKKMPEPARFKNDMKLMLGLSKILVNKMDEFEKLKDLSFIDFKTIKKELDYLNKTEHKNYSSYLTILPILAQLSEFIRGYKSH